MSNEVTIYALSDDTGVRYIGQTRQPLTLRVYQHRFDLATGGAAKIAWIKTLRAAGQKPGVQVLEVVGRTEAAQAERRHIAAARARGCQLLNATDGGERGRTSNDGGEVVRVALRLPRQLHGQLQQMATDEDRSLHAQILWSLRQCTARRSKARPDS